MTAMTPEEKARRHIRAVIWLYFVLLVIEGALRKWIFPQLSNPLLIIRDPVVIVAYFLALRSGLFPRNGWVYWLAGIGFLSVIVSFLILWPYLPPLLIAFVTLYGFRSDFLHLPLIFLMPKMMNLEHVKKVGWWVLLLMLPMAALMVGQFEAPPDSFLNRTAGGEGEMMMSALGKVRTAATFSFVIGVVGYFALATGFLIWAALTRGVYRHWLMIGAASALVVGTAVSGSRSVVGACAVVIASLLVVLLLRPSSVGQSGRVLLAAVLLAMVVTRVPTFREGFNVMTARFSESAEASETSITGDIFSRFTGSLGEGFRALTKAPILGYGLGIGTNGGARFLIGRSGFLLSESEWSRIFLESGPILGLAFIVWRCALIGWVGVLCLRSVRLGNLLPLLLFASAFLPLLNGQFGQPTLLGFAVFTTGLTLAALRKHEPVVIAEGPFPPSATESSPKRIRGRSAYAEQLHGTGTAPAKPNGAVDR